MSGFISYLVYSNPFVHIVSLNFALLTPQSCQRCGLHLISTSNACTMAAIIHYLLLYNCLYIETSLLEKAFSSFLYLIFYLENHAQQVSKLKLLLVFLKTIHRADPSENYKFAIYPQDYLSSTFEFLGVINISFSYIFVQCDITSISFSLVFSFLKKDQLYLSFSPGLQGFIFLFMYM